MSLDLKRSKILMAINFAVGDAIAPPDWAGLSAYGYKTPFAGCSIFLSSQSFYNPALVYPKPMVCSEIIGTSDTIIGEESGEFFFSPKPHHIRYSADGDFQLYATAFNSGIAQVLGKQPLVSNCSADDLKAFKHEKGVHHYGYSGSVSQANFDLIYTPQGGSHLVNSDINYWDNSFRPGHSSFAFIRGSRSATADHYSYIGVGTSSPYTSAASYDLFDYVSKLVQHIGTGYYDVWKTYPAPIRSGRYTNVSLTGSSVDFTIRYNYFYQYYNSGLHVTVRSSDYLVEEHVSLYPRRVVGHHSPLADNLFYDCLGVNYERNVSSLGGATGYGEGPILDPTPSIGYALPMSRPLNVDDNYLSDFNDFRHNPPSGSTRDRAEEMYEQVLSNMVDIRPASFLSASKALDTYIGVLGSNNLQNLQHLTGVLEALPDLGSIGPILAKVARGDVGVLYDILDYVTELILKYNFELNPTLKDTAEALRTDVSGRLAAIAEPATRSIYGSFTYEFLPEENFVGPGRLVLDCRSKIRLTTDFSTLMASIVAANGVGLLPTLSRLWSLVPFSFVVDWFTNESARLHTVDNALLYLALRTHWVLWSYKLTYYPTEGELLAHNLVSYDDSVPLAIFVYIRDFSYYMPSLRNSRFDFLRRTKEPRFEVVGSLIFQLLT